MSRAGRHATLRIQAFRPHRFAELTSKWLRRGTHRSTKELVASIRTWITD